MQDTLATTDPVHDDNTPALERLLAVMAALRAPGAGCPWDLEQTCATIAAHTIEEAYEVADAIERNDMADLKDELGDLLLQVVFHSQIACDDGLFDFHAVAAGAAAKMLRRHPHVFGGAAIEDAKAQAAAWEAIKAAERAAKAPDAPLSALDGVSVALPAVARAQKLQKRAATAGFDWTRAEDVLGKIEEELGEVREAIAAGTNRLEDEIGDLLFAAINLARKSELDAETALRRANAKFERRFRRIEALLRARGRAPRDAGLEEMETLWAQVKVEERSP